METATSRMRTIRGLRVKQIITKQVMNNGEYITVIHLGKTPTDTIQTTELTTTDAGRMLRY